MTTSRISSDSCAELQQRIRNCQHCKGLPLGPKPIVQLHARARILIAGQAPGIRAHNAGQPFDDPSGNRLRQWLGVDRQAFYDPRNFAIAPMGFCYPGTGKNGDLPPRVECAPKWRQQILDSLPELALTLVIGQYALRWHIPASANATVTRVVSDWKQYWPTMLPLPHPSPRNNRWLKNNTWFETDVIPALQHRVADLLPDNMA